MLLVRSLRSQLGDQTFGRTSLALLTIAAALGIATAAVGIA